MSLLHMEGFEDGMVPVHATHSIPGTRYTSLTHSLNSAAYVAGRAGGFALRAGWHQGNELNGHNMLFSSSTNNPTIGFAWRTINLLSASQKPICAIGAGASLGTTSVMSHQCQLKARADGHIDFVTVQQGTSPVVRASSTGTPPLSTTSTPWHYIEMSVVLATTAVGSVTVKVDGATVIAATNIVTAVNNTTATLITMCGTADSNSNATSSHLFDDLYVVNNDGTAPSGFLGDCVVEYLLPNGTSFGAGVASDGSASSSNHLMVDDPAGAQPSMTDYVQFNNAGDRDAYNFVDSARTSAVHALEVHNYVQKADATGTAAGRGHVVLSSEARFGTTVALTDVPKHLVDRYVRRPDNNASWSAADVNALLAGFDRAS